MNKEVNAGMSCVGILTLLIGTVVIGAILNGWALSVLWGWFIIPVFGLPALSIVQAIGVGMVVSLLTEHAASDSKESSDIWTALATGTSKAVLVPLITLAIGWIVALFL